MVREVLIYPDPELKQKAKPVSKVDDAIRELVQDMIDTMYAEHGVGLAATQLGVHKRIIVIDASSQQEGEKLRVFINPELLDADGRTKYSEGCLSIPGETEEIERFLKVSVRALDQNGEPFEVEAEGLLSIALQHEMDHLDGVLFVDRLSSVKRGTIRKKMLDVQAARKRAQRKSGAPSETRNASA